jgi:hypothetical protein
VSRSATDLLAGGRWRPLLTLGLLVAAVYAPALGFDFVRWDDFVNITRNPLLTEPWSRELLAKLVNGDTALRFKPLPWLLYRATHACFGFNPMAWHGLNLVLHLAAVGMAWAVFRATLARLRPATPAGARDFLAWLGAAVWAVHPAHVEAAVWATATPYPLVVFFLLASFRCYLRATDPAHAAERRRYFVWSWLLAAGGYLSYPVGVTYGLWLAVADFWLLGRAPRDPRSPTAWLRWAVVPGLFLLPAVASVLVTFQSTVATSGLYPAPTTLADVSVPVRLQMAAAMLAAVWTHFLWPFGLTPNNVMIPPEIVHGPMILGLAALAVGVVVLALVGQKRAPGFAATILGSAVLALPVLGFTQWPTWSVSDRHIYLPHLVLTGAMVTWLAARVPAWSPTAGRAEPARRSGSTMAAVALAGLAGLAWLGARQVQIWRNTDTLFRYFEKQPAFAWNPAQQAYIYQLWASDAAEAGRPGEAQAKNLQARRILVDAMQAEAGRRRWAEALEYSLRLEEAFGLPPVLRRERVRWRMELGDLPGARAELQRVRRELPGDAATEDLAREWRQRAGGKDL